MTYMYQSFVCRMLLTIGISVNRPREIFHITQSNHLQVLYTSRNQPMLEELRIQVSPAFVPINSAHNRPRCVLEKTLRGDRVVDGVNKRDKEEKEKLLQGMMEEAYSINANAIRNSLAVLYLQVIFIPPIYIFQ